MSELKRENLIHNYGMPMEIFLKRIEETGGWPENFLYVSFFHAVEDDKRFCIFTNQFMNTGWYTTILNRDEYYWWKISKEKKTKIKDNFLREYWLSISPSRK